VAKRVKKEKQLRAKKACKLCKVGMSCDQAVSSIDYKDVHRLRRFMTDRGKITPRRITGTCAHGQRALAAAIKRARVIALVPFVKEYYR
jgi:small subunit ribosomal protein S18